MKNYKTSKRRIYTNNGYQYIYIYYKEDGHTLKINTKLLYEKNKMTKENLYNKKKENYQKLNTYIQETQYAVDTYINLVSGHKPVNQRDCMTFVRQNKYNATKTSAETINKLTSLNEYYSQFFESKKTNPLIRKISLKNYKTFENFLTDYQKFKKKKLYLFDINKELINELIRFSRFDLTKLDGYKTKGHLQQNTLIKRLDAMKEFLTWLSDEKSIPAFNINKLFPKIEKTSKEIIYVTVGEIIELINTRDKIDGEYEKIVFDSFIFNCEVGLRFHDLNNLSKSDFKKIPQGFILKKELHKHNQKFATESTIPIVHPILIEIIETYNFTFKLKTNQQYNRTLKRLFKKHELFTEPVIIKRKYIAEDDKLDELLKNDVITCHSCRRSMITNSFKDGSSIPQVMQMSGHKNLKTLQKYINFANSELLNKNLIQKLNQINNDSEQESP